MPQWLSHVFAAPCCPHSIPLPALDRAGSSPHLRCSRTSLDFNLGRPYATIILVKSCQLSHFQSEPTWKLLPRSTRHDSWQIGLKDRRRRRWLSVGFGLRMQPWSTMISISSDCGFKHTGMLVRNCLIGYNWLQLTSKSFCKKRKWPPC